MEFIGRVARILPARTGVSQRTGNEWKALPFVFEYFENETDRYPDSVLLETFDVNVIAHLKENMEVRCGFAHRTRDYEGKTYNDVRLYKIECLKLAKQAPNSAVNATGQPTPNGVGTTAGAAQGAQDPFPPAEGKDDDLPF